MDWEVAAHCLLIFGARVLDVSIGTVRTLAVVNGKKLMAWVLGVVEILIWILVAAQVITSVKDNLWYGVFYAMGFATGGYVGMSIESWLAMGERAVMVFTRQGDLVSDRLREQDLLVTEWQGTGKDGPITILFVKLPRRQVAAVTAQLRMLDPACIFTVERVEGSVRPTLVPATGWRATDKKGK